MYNTLKVMLDAVSKEELLKYSKELANKPPAEIKEILKSFNIELSDNAANECYEYLNAVNELSDEELENVTGGCTSTYSSVTYSSLDITPSSKYHQSSNYHPLITTAFNSCELIQDGHICGGCYWSAKPSNTLTLYCEARSQESDTGRS